MTENRTVIAQFCDDFRQEIGNKFSLMGCYGTDLYVPQFPITLPKLCVFVYVRTPKENPFGTLTLRVMRAEQALATLRANPDRLDAAEEMPSWTRWLVRTRTRRRDASTKWSTSAPIRASSLPWTQVQNWS